MKQFIKTFINKLFKKKKTSEEILLEEIRNELKDIKTILTSVRRKQSYGEYYIGNTPN